MAKWSVPNDRLFSSVKDCLHRGQSIVIRIRGNSMLPFLRDNRDLVTLRAVAPGDLKTGTIILFKYKTKYLLHRIVKKKRTNFYLRGDNNWSFRFETCAAEDIQGVVVAIERNGRKIPCDSWKWRFCSYLWMKSHPLRVMLFKGHRFLKKLITSKYD